MPSLAITQVKSVRVVDGGYQFTVNFSGPLAINQKALIEFGTTLGAGVSRTATVDITDALRGKTNWTGAIGSFALLGDVLACLGRNQLMEKKVKARGVLWTSEQSKVVSSAAALFDSPVLPVSTCSYRLAEQEFKLHYTGLGTGRLLFNVTGQSEIAANYYFVYAGKLETDPMMRGFDCTTFLMAALKQFSNVPTASGEAVAAQAGKTRQLNKVTRQELVSAIQASHADKVAIVLIHTGTTDVTHHCVLVRDGLVFEFNKVSAQPIGLTPAGSKGGFMTDLAKWRANDPNSVYSLFV